MTCPRPSYYFNTLCLPLRSFYLSDFSRTHHLGPSRGQTGARRQEERGREGSNDLLETSAIGCYGEKKGGVRGWTVRGKKKCVRVKEVGVQLVMDLTESCLWRRQKLG